MSSTTTTGQGGISAGEADAIRRGVGAIGRRLAGRALLAPLGPLGWAIGAAMVAYDAYELYQVYNKSHEETEATDPEECVGSCAEERERKEQEARDFHDNGLDDLEGMDYDEAEGILDEKLRDGAGWKKEPLTRGEGSKYSNDNDSRQVRINRGYPDGNRRGPSDDMHSGPYITRPSTQTRIKLRRHGVGGAGV